jgi:hypothetical protein
MNIKLYFFTSFLVGIIVGTFLFADREMIFPEVKASTESYSQISGKLLSSSADKVVLQTNTGIKEIALASDAMIHKDSRDALPGDLKAGDQATVVMNSQGVASTVESVAISPLHWSTETIASLISGGLLFAAAFIIWKKYRTLHYFAPPQRISWHAY